VGREGDETPVTGESKPVLGGGEIRQRAMSGALLLGARGTLILGLGMVANIVLARLLVPRDFGLVALGTVVLTFGGYLASGGLGAALVGRAEPPSRRELHAIAGVQMALGSVLVLAGAAAAVAFGRDGLVVATMIAALPITLLKTPAMIVLERDLEYRAIAGVDVIEAIAFYAWALTTVALGMGVWGMATGMVVRAVAGTAAMTALGPVGLVRPRWDWPAVQPMVAFGVKFQGIPVVGLVREQGMNVAVAAIGGIAMLGVWNLAWRVIQVPFMLFASIGRVAYPAMSRLLAAGEDPRPVIERGLGTVCVATGLLLVGLVGFVPALPELVGSDWSDVPETLLWASLALMIGGPTSMVSWGYLYAADAVGTAVRIQLVQMAAWFAVTLPLLSELGAPAVGIGWVAGATVNATLLRRAVRRRTGAAFGTTLGLPTALAALAGALGWLIAAWAGETVLAGMAGALGAELALLAGLALVRRSLLRQTYLLVRRSVRGAPAAEVPA
jgi:O-antigen/teichoic acid export membrane protein